MRLSFFTPANNAGYGKLYVKELTGSGVEMRQYKVNLRRTDAGDWVAGLIKWIKGGRDRFDGALSEPDGSQKDPSKGDECACSVPGEGGRWVTDRDGNERWIDAPPSGEYPQPVEVVPGEIDPEPIAVE